MKRNVLPWGLLLPLAVSAFGQIPRPGIDCGCDRTGAYVRSGIASVAWNALQSPRGTFTVEPFAAGNGLVVRQAGKEVLTFGPASAAIGWGFGPDERGLVIHATRPGEPRIPSQHFVWLYNLATPAQAAWEIQTTVGEAMSVFSPAGRYLLHVSRSPVTGMHLWAVEVGSLTEV
jgi:hypothetical protein